MKDNKKSMLLCKQLLEQLSLHPKQELFDISRFSDQMFQVMNKVNNMVC